VVLGGGVVSYERGTPVGVRVQGFEFRVWCGRRTCTGVPGRCSRAECAPSACRLELNTTCGSEAGSNLRLIDSCITQLKAQGPYQKKKEDHLRLTHQFEFPATATPPSRTSKPALYMQRHVLHTLLLSTLQGGAEHHLWFRGGLVFEAHRLLYYSA